MKKSVSLLFSSQITDPQVFSVDDLLEEIIVIFDCTDDEDLRQKCLAWAKQNEHEYQNESGETVKWKFVDILHYSPLEIEELQDGTEVFSRFMNSKQAKVLTEKL